MQLPDFVGLALRVAPEHGMLRRLQGRWERSLAADDVRRRRVTGVGRLDLRMRYPYERAIWLRPEQLEDVRYTQSLLCAGGVFVDCGANIGLWTLAGAAAVGSRGHVVAFEPAPEVFSQLAHNVELNDFGARTTLVRCALGGQSGSHMFDTGGAFHNTGRLVPHAAPGPAVETLRVETETLDGALGRRSVDGLKIDVEGDELGVLVGARTLLRRELPWVIVEYNADELDSDRLGDWPVHRWLVGEGWSARRLAPGEQPLEGDWRRHRGLGHMNLLYRPDPQARQ